MCQPQKPFFEVLLRPGGLVPLSNEALRCDATLSRSLIESVCAPPPNAVFVVPSTSRTV